VTTRRRVSKNKNNGRGQNKSIEISRVVNVRQRAGHKQLWQVHGQADQRDHYGEN